jgi:hypothetical protein
MASSNTFHYFTPGSNSNSSTDLHKSYRSVNISNILASQATVLYISLEFYSGNQHQREVSI